VTTTGQRLPLCFLDRPKTERIEHSRLRISRQSGYRLRKWRYLSGNVRAILRDPPPPTAGQIGIPSAPGLLHGSLDR
jgi:hypothetical protein